MSVLIRTLLICLMALTLPLQGVASTLSLACAMTGQSSTHTATEAQAPSAHAHADHTAHAAPADHADHSGHADHDADATGTHNPCSAGAHCSLCSAMPPQWATPTLPALDAPAVRLSLHTTPPSSVSPDGLERPPRRTLA